jgi:hypothetical protein
MSDLCVLLSPAAQQYDQHRAALQVVHAIARPVVDAHLADASTDWPYVTGVTERQPADTGFDPCPGSAIRKSCHPGVKRRRILGIAVIVGLRLEFLVNPQCPAS